MITVKINVDTGVIMQKISFLLLGTSLSLVPQTLNAQCVSPIQDCYALGYTQTSCPNGKGVKCPFGSGWYCGGTAAQDCIKLGYDKDCTGAGESGNGETCNGKYQSCTCDSSYQYTCTGTGYSGGSGSACGGKYTKCTCKSGYKWSNGKCIEAVSPVACDIGTLYYSDKKCYNQKIDSKKLLGVVIYTNENGGGWIMSTEKLSGTWGDMGTDIAGLLNYNSVPNDIQASCSNTDIILASGGSHPAAEAANNYRPAGTPAGKRWCLPSGGLFSTIADIDKVNKINAGITIAGGDALADTRFGMEHIPSSSEQSYARAWYLYVSETDSKISHVDIRHIEKNFFDVRVRPVMEF